MLTIVSTHLCVSKSYLAILGMHVSVLLTSATHTQPDMAVDD